MNKAFAYFVWENFPSDATPVNDANLMKVNNGLEKVDNRVIYLDSSKFDKSEAQLLVRNIEYDENTGIFKITHYNGASYTIDTLLEKIAINFDYDPYEQKLIIQLSDGTEKYVNLSALITQYEFLDSDTIHFTIEADGKVKAEVKEGSIHEKHLRPDYLADIKVEVAKAEASKTAAAESEKNAKVSENAAKESENAAKKSENAASVSASNAEASASSADQSADNALGYAGAAGSYKMDALASATAALNSEKEAEELADSAWRSERLAAESAESALDCYTAASRQAAEASGHADKAKSYAEGGTGTREGEDTDNSKYFSELAQKLVDQAQKIIAAASTGALIPAGTITFADLPENAKTGYMYNISSGFTTDSRFEEGAGIYYSPGANVYWTADGKWDVMTGIQVTGVKGNSESVYRVGNVNLTADNIGAVNKSGDLMTGILRIAGTAASGPLRVRGIWGVQVDGIEKGPLHLQYGANQPVHFGNSGGYTISADGGKYSGTSASADRLSTARTIVVTGDIVGSGSFDGSQNLTISALRRGCTVGQSEFVTTNPWYKVASIVLSKTNNESHLILQVWSGYSDNSTLIGILKIHARALNLNGIWDRGELVWEVAGSGIDISKFQMLHSTTSPCTVELWVKIDYGSRRIHFNVIAESTMESRMSNLWTLYNTVGTGQASPTSGYVAQNSILATLENSIATYNNVGIKWISGEYDSALIRAISTDSLTVMYFQPAGGDTVTAMSQSIAIVKDKAKNTYSFQPMEDNSYNLGTIGNRWKQLYAASTAISTSDEELKKDIKSLDDELTARFILGLNPISFKFIDNDSNRTHYGLGARAVEKLMESLGMSSLDFAGFIKSPKIRLKENTDPKEFVTEEIQDKYDYGLRYEEFIAPLIKMAQIQQKEINSLKETVQMLQEQVQQIKA